MTKLSEKGIPNVLNYFHVIMVARKTSHVQLSIVYLKFPISPWKASIMAVSLISLTFGGRKYLFPRYFSFTEILHILFYLFVTQESSRSAELSAYSDLVG